MTTKTDEIIYQYLFLCSKNASLVVFVHHINQLTTVLRQFLGSYVWRENPLDPGVKLSLLQKRYFYDLNTFDA